MDSGSGGCLNSRVHLSAKVAALEQIVRWRDLYRAEMNCQIIHDSIHSRPGWTVEYILRAGDKPAGYGSIAVAGPWKKNRSIYEFFVLPQFRSQLFDLFAELVRACGVSRIETQSNDVLLTSMLHAFAPSTKSESILYYDKLTTTFAPADATFRVATVADQPDVPVEQLPSHGVVEYKGRVAGKGGILFHYNQPYGDIYMEVGKEFR